MPEDVRASVQVGPRRHKVREFALPSVGGDDAIMRVEACGVCGSDIEQYTDERGRRPQPTIPGHEPLGIIEQIGANASRRWGVKEGDRVALESFLPCHDCDMCAREEFLSCRNGRLNYGYSPTLKEPSLWGGFGQYMYLHPNTMLHKIRKDLPAEVAVMYNPLGAGVRWANHLGGVKPGDTVLVLGPGQRGIACVIAAKAAGAETVITTGLERDDFKLRMAQEFGADHIINVDKEDTVARVTDITRGRLCDVVVDVTPGAIQPIRDALQCVRHGGRFVLAGLKHGHEMTFRPDDIIQKGIQVLGAYAVDYAAYEEAIRIIESERFPLARLHTHTFGLTDTTAAIETLINDPKAVHVSVSPNA